MQKPGKFSRLLLAIWFLWTLGFLPSSKAQSSISPSSVAETEAIQARSYRLLFRRTLLFEKRAADADAAGTPKPHLRRIIPQEMKLDAFDTASLLRLAQAWQKEYDVIEASRRSGVSQFASRFPDRKMSLASNLTLPAIIKESGIAQIALMLRYRLMLENVLRPETFSSIELELRSRQQGALSSSTQAVGVAK